MGSFNPGIEKASQRGDINPVLAEIIRGRWLQLDQAEVNLTSTMEVDGITFSEPTNTLTDVSTEQPTMTAYQEQGSDDAARV